MLSRFPKRYVFFLVFFFCRSTGTTSFRTISPRVHVHSPFDSELFSCSQSLRRPRLRDDLFSVDLHIARCGYFVVTHSVRAVVVSFRQSSESCCSFGLEQVMDESSHPCLYYCTGRTKAAKITRCSTETKKNIKKGTE